ncbi:MAG TPA: hypothetical protein PKA41_16255 [Verrucomicrobiota bacterium]|nr:hypothetical protein [Verrucomicrobiota bacterium]
MKDREQEKNDPALSALLKAWKLEERLPPTFQERVWRRIETAEAGSAFNIWPDWLVAPFTRPAFATACASVLLAAGLIAGFWRADRDAARWDGELSHRYVAAVDPYATRP